MKIVFLMYLINFLKRIFTGEVFWIAIGSMITSTALVYEIGRDGRKRKKELDNIRESLISELILNIDLLFIGEVERVSIFTAVNKIRDSFVDDIKDLQKFMKVQRLYADLEFYQRFVSKVYLNSNISNSGSVTTEKQLQTCNSFLNFFGHNSIEYDSNKVTDFYWNKEGKVIAYMDEKRDEAIICKGKNFEEWKNKISKFVKEML